MVSPQQSKTVHPQTGYELSQFQLFHNFKTASSHLEAQRYLLQSSFETLFDTQKNQN